MKYLVCDSWGKELRIFKTEEQRTRWLKKYCWWSGIHWIVYDLSKFPYNVTSRTLYIEEE